MKKVYIYIVKPIVKPHPNLIGIFEPEPNLILAGPEPEPESCDLDWHLRLSAHTKPSGRPYNQDYPKIRNANK